MNDCPCIIKVTNVSSENLITVQINQESPDLKVVTTEDTNSFFDTEAMSNVIIRKGFSPFVNPETDTWFEYDETLGGFVDTHIIAGTVVMSIEDVKESWIYSSGVIEEED